MAWRRGLVVAGLGVVRQRDAAGAQRRLEVGLQPLEAGLVIVTNDLIWWPGFALALWPAWRARR